MKKVVDPADEVTNTSGTTLYQPVDRAAREIWRRGVQAVRRPDGTVDHFEVANWLMTRKGGIHADWPQLREGQRAIASMQKETVDLGRIMRQHEEEEDEKWRKEERRLANKRRYQPRSQWRKEKEEAKREAKTKVQGIATSEEAHKRKSARPQEGFDAPVAKRQRLDTNTEPSGSPN